jgi:hypothetical protein
VAISKKSIDKPDKDTSISIGFETKLWVAAEYKHVIMGLNFLTREQPHA